MRRKMIAALVAVVSLTVVAVAAAQTLPRRLNLPNGWQPEGIAAGAGNQLFVGSLASGAVIRVDARTGRSRIVVGGGGGRGADGRERPGHPPLRPGRGRRPRGGLRRALGPPAQGLPARAGEPGL